MMTLISLAIIVAFGTSLAATFGLFEVEVWWKLLRQAENAAMTWASAIITLARAVSGDPFSQTEKPESAADVRPDGRLPCSLRYWPVMTPAREYRALRSRRSAARTPK